MKKIAYILLAAAVAFASCQKVEFNYTPDNEDVSFPASSETYSLQGQKIEIPIVRGVGKEALSLAISLNDQDGVFTLETPVVNFAANEFEQTIVVSYNLDDLAPAVKYTFNVTFDEKNMSVVGTNMFAASAMMPLEYEPYGEVTVDNSYVKSLFPVKTYELQRAKYTTNYYMIKGMYGSDVDMEFCVRDGLFEVLSPLGTCKYFGTYPLFVIPSGAMHPSYGQFTGYLDPDPEYCYVTGAEADGTLPVGAILEYDVFWTVPAGYFHENFDHEDLEVTKVL